MLFPWSEPGVIRRHGPLKRAVDVQAAPQHIVQSIPLTMMAVAGTSAAQKASFASHACGRMNMRGKGRWISSCFYYAWPALAARKPSQCCISRTSLLWGSLARSVSFLTQLAKHRASGLSPNSNSKKVPPKPPAFQYSLRWSRKRTRGWTDRQPYRRN